MIFFNKMVEFKIPEETDRKQLYQVGNAECDSELEQSLRKAANKSNVSCRSLRIMVLSSSYKLYRQPSRNLFQL